MQRHLNDMRTALGLARSENLTDEQRRLFTTSLLETLAEAKFAWDAYCEHLAEHGLLSKAKAPHFERPGT